MTDKLETELAALKARSEEQQARIEELERKANPPAPPKFEGTPGPTTTQIAMDLISPPKFQHDLCWSFGNAWFLSFLDA